ncbi:MAG TPA: tripartite tricarboxylate transporter substrate binding protein [Burkholderiaceae bacterium]
MLAASLFVVVFSAGAQSWPSKPLHMIVPFPAGGGSDVVGRVIAQKLTERLGQQVVVDNRGGAGGSMGTEMAVRAVPDGYTMVLASTSEIAINPSLYSKLSYSTVKDLVPVALVATTPMVVIVNPSLTVNSIQDLVTLARNKPGEINVASAGSGTISHLSSELFRSMVGLNWTHVPYRGTGPALSDLAGGQVQIMFSPPPPALNLVKGNLAKVIAVSGRTRTPTLPNVPTVMEALNINYAVDNWYGIFVPVGTPSEIVSRLAGEIAQSVGSPEVVSTLAVQGAAPGTMSTEEFREYVKSEVGKWGAVVKATGAKMD